MRSLGGLSQPIAQIECRLPLIHSRNLLARYGLFARRRCPRGNDIATMRELMTMVAVFLSIQFIGGNNSGLREIGKRVHIIANGTRRAKTSRHTGWKIRLLCAGV